MGDGRKKERKEGRQGKRKGVIKIFLSEIHSGIVIL